MSIKRQIADFVKTPVKVKMSHKRGTYGVYMPVSERVGVKILTSDNFSTIKELKSSGIWADAIAELNNMRKVRKRIRIKSTVPKSYMVLPVKIEEQWLTPVEGTNRYTRETLTYYAPGIFMEHIDGKRLTTVVKSYGTRSMVRSTLEEMFLKKGVDHDDMHDFNILVRNNYDRKSKYVVIDWDDTYVHIV